MDQEQLVAPLGITGSETQLPPNASAEQWDANPTEGWNRRLSRGLGFGLIVTAIIAIIANIPWFFNNHDIQVIGVGFWGGLLVLLTGMLLLVRAATPSRRLIKGVTVACVVALVADLCILANGANQLNRSDYMDEDEWEASKGLGVVFSWVGVVGFDLLMVAIIQNSIALQGAANDHPASPSGTENTIVLTQPATMQPAEWNPRAARGLGIALIVLSAIASTCNIGWFFVDCSLANAGVGFWAGAFVYVTGLLLVFSASRRLRSLIIAAMVVAIVAIVFCLGFIGVGAFQLTWACDEHHLGTGFAALFLAIGGVSLILLLTTIILTAISVCGRNRLVAYLPVELLSPGARSAQGECNLGDCKMAAHFTESSP